MLQYSNAFQHGNKLPSRQLLGSSIGCLDKSFDTLLGLSSNIEQQSSGALNRVLSEPCHGKCDQQKDRLPTPSHEAWHHSWLEQNPSWTRVLWTDEQNRALVQSHFPWLLAVYDSMEGVYRADLVRA